MTEYWNRFCHPFWLLLHQASSSDTQVACSLQSTLTHLFIPTDLCAPHLMSLFRYLLTFGFHILHVSRIALVWRLPIWVFSTISFCSCCITILVVSFVVLYIFYFDSVIKYLFFNVAFCGQPCVHVLHPNEILKYDKWQKKKIRLPRSKAGRFEAKNDVSLVSWD